MGREKMAKQNNHVLTHCSLWGLWNAVTFTVYIYNIYCRFITMRWFLKANFITFNFLQLRWKVCLLRLLKSAQTAMLSGDAVVISHPQERRDFNGGWIRAADASDPELWKNKALFSCWERSLQDSIRASHKRAQLLDLGWEWMERTRARAKPQKQTPNLANKHQPRECQLGTQMHVVFFCLRHTAHT